jgi:hypothetical protein
LTFFLYCSSTGKRASPAQSKRVDVEDEHAAATATPDSFRKLCSVNKHGLLLTKSIKREDIRDEHKLDRAPNDLIVGWKAWIRNHGPNKGGIASRIERPADGLRTVVRDD